ncbi:hypothetical protein [Lysobacter antibioticus]|jgi:hypothetical protein|uniref:hypothetical protein n=1 Tax=Lysobacter antibioticus TaxID=84531 RepID=UPI0007166903|nr:hypothetical protein [Lysobacter antibioticus]
MPAEFFALYTARIIGAIGEANLKSHMRTATPAPECAGLSACAAPPPTARPRRIARRSLD